MKKYLPIKLTDSFISAIFDKITTIKDLEKDYQNRLTFQEQDLKNAQENDLIRKENHAEIEAIVSLAKSFGYKVNEYVMGRGKTKSHYKDEKWVTELKKQLPGLSWSYLYSKSQIEEKYAELKRTYLKRKQQIEQVESNAKRSEEAKNKIAMKEKLAIRLAVKYNLPEDLNDRDSIYEALVGKDKYIMLSNAMEATRNDWSDGFYRVEYALDRFEVSCQTDIEIIADLARCMSGDYERDGRVFRDTTWNYNRIRELANKELLEDIQKITGEFDEYQ